MLLIKGGALTLDSSRCKPVTPRLPKVLPLGFIDYRLIDLLLTVSYWRQMDNHSEVNQLPFLSRKHFLEDRNFET